MKAGCAAGCCFPTSREWTLLAGKSKSLRARPGFRTTTRSGSSDSRLKDIPSENLRLVVPPPRLDADKLVGFDDVRSEGVTVNATGVQPDCLWTSTRFRRGPVSKEHNFFAVVDVVPGRAFLALAVGPEHTNAR